MSQPKYKIGDYMRVYCGSYQDHCFYVKAVREGARGFEYLYDGILMGGWYPETHIVRRAVARVGTTIAMATATIRGGGTDMDIVEKLRHGVDTNELPDKTDAVMWEAADAIEALRHDNDLALAINEELSKRYNEARAEIDRLRELLTRATDE